MKFILQIELGNDAMQTQTHIGHALRALGTSLLKGTHFGLVQREPVPGDSGPIHDENGNRVGGWHVE